MVAHNSLMREIRRVDDKIYNLEARLYRKSFSTDSRINELRRACDKREQSSNKTFIVSGVSILLLAASLCVGAWNRGKLEERIDALEAAAQLTEIDDGPGAK